MNPHFTNKSETKKQTNNLQFVAIISNPWQEIGQTKDQTNDLSSQVLNITWTQGETT